MSLIKMAIGRLLETDPAEWLGYQLTEPQDPMPETVGEAMDMVKAKAKMAIDSATRQSHAENKRLRGALENAYDVLPKYPSCAKECIRKALTLKETDEEES